MITRQELLDALTAYTRSTQVDLNPADHPAVAALLNRLPEYPEYLPYGVQIGNGNSQTNTFWGRG